MLEYFPEYLTEYLRRMIIPDSLRRTQLRRDRRAAAALIEHPLHWAVVVTSS